MKLQALLEVQNLWNDYNSTLTILTVDGKTLCKLETGVPISLYDYEVLEVGSATISDYIVILGVHSTDIFYDVEADEYFHIEQLMVSYGRTNMNGKISKGIDFATWLYSQMICNGGTLQSFS